MGETQTQVDVGVREDCLRELRQGRLFAGVARQQMHQKMRLAVAVSKLLVGARVEFAFTLESRFCHRELLWF